MPDNDNYREVCPNYQEAVEELITQSKYESEYIDFAKVYLAYEYNYYCKRTNKVFYYDVKNLIKVAKTLKRNSFAYYKIGYIYKNWSKDYLTALEFFHCAVEENPMYYRALFQEGVCQYKLGKANASKKILERLADILEAKVNADIMKPMEIEYLYKTYLVMGEMEYKKYGNIYRAVFRYKQAEQVWEYVKESEGKKMIQMSHMNEKLLGNYFKRWIDRVDISVIREKIYQLYKNADDKDGVAEYE